MGGRSYPIRLVTRTLRAACLLDEDNRASAAAGLDGVRKGLEARKLRPEHRYFRHLEEVEARLRNTERWTDEA